MGLVAHLDLLVKEGSLDRLVRMDRQVQLDQVDPVGHLGLGDKVVTKESKDPRALKVQLVMMAARGSKAHKDQQDQVDLKGPMDHQDHQGLQDLKEKRAIKELLVHLVAQVAMGHVDKLVHLGHQDQQDRPGQPVHLVILVIEDKLVQPDLVALEVNPERLDNPDLLGPQDLVDLVVQLALQGSLESQEIRG